MYNIKKHILEYEDVNYAKEEVVERDYINCSFGINPFGCSKKIKDAIKDIPIKDITNYPESSKNMKEAIIGYWANIANLTIGNIFLGNGSIGVLYTINNLLLEKGDRILGYGPQFSAYIGDIIRNNIEYDFVQLEKEYNYKFNHNNIIKAIKEEHKLIYIDNPNNPTGQIIPLEEIEEIAYAANAMNKIVMVDEAYGEFMPNENSAINLIKDYKNVVVARTMSKGFGLPGIRAGYLIADDFIIKQYSKIGEIFDCNGIARYLSCIALKDKEFITNSIKQIKVNKQKLLNSLEGLIYAYTSIETPIIMLIHPDENVNLWEGLMEKGIKTIPLESFIGAGKNSVRLRIPNNIDELLNRLRCEDALLNV